MEDKLDTILLRLSKLQKTVDALKESMDAHKVEHGFAKMQDGGVNAHFTGQQSPPGMGGMPMGGGGMPKACLEWVKVWVRVIRCLVKECL